MHSLSVHDPHIADHNLLWTETNSSEDCIKAEPLVHHYGQALFCLAIRPHDSWYLVLIVAKK